MTVDDLGSIEVWPEHYQVYSVFIAMNTQWRTGMNGVTGLDYNALREVWDRTRTPEEDRDEIFYELQIMERAALEEIREQQSKSK